MSSFTQNICAECWNKERPNDIPVVVAMNKSESDKCCMCGKDNNNGIFIRRDPKSVPYPS